MRAADQDGVHGWAGGAVSWIGVYSLQVLEVRFVGGGGVPSVVCS